MSDKYDNGLGVRVQASKLQIAVAYAERLGWSIGPLLPDNKIPPFKDWWNKTTNDPDRLADFWSPEHKLIGETRSGRKVYSNPDYNIGLDTEKSGVICIDCDEKDGKHGIANLRKLAAEHGVELGPDADVFMTRSASGGKHAYFEGDTLQSKNGVLADGIDVKSKKALAVLPGSTINGKPYTPVGKLRKPGKSPQWLVDAIAQKWTKATPVALMMAVPRDDPADIAMVKARLETEAQSIQGSGGNANLIRVIRTLWDAGITADTAIGLLGPWNDRNDPPWDDGELEYKVHSAYQNTENAFGCRSLAVEFGDLDEVERRDAEATAAILRRIIDTEEMVFGTLAAEDAEKARVMLDNVIEDHKALRKHEEDAEQDAGTGGYECLSNVERRASKANRREPIIKGKLSKGDFMCIYGLPSTGKSLEGPYIAHGISRGEDVFGCRVRQCPVIYAAFEDPAGMMDRLDTLENIYGEAPELYLVRGLSNLKKGGSDFKRLCASAEQHKAGVIVIDTQNPHSPASTRIRRRAWTR